MNDDDIYDSDFVSDFEDLVNVGKDIQIVYFDNIDQFRQSEKELNKIGDVDHNSNTAQYIIMKPIKIRMKYVFFFSYFHCDTFYK